MLGSVLPLTGLCVVWYFTVKARGEVFYSEITRNSNDDTFTNEYCNDCSSFGAEVDVHHTGRCKCKAASTNSLFLRSERRCKTGLSFKKKEGCLHWDHSAPVFIVKVIDVTKVNCTYKFIRDWNSPCQLTQYVAYLDVTGNWKNFNLSADVLEVKRGVRHPRDSFITITKKSPSLTNLSGHIIKLGLNCTGTNPSQTCLLFRVKGVVKFPLCNFTLPSTFSPSPSTFSPPPSTFSPSPSTFSPSPTRSLCSTAHGSITSTSSVNIPNTTTKPPPSPSLTVAEIIPPLTVAGITAIILAVVLFLALIGAVLYFLCKKDHICKSRERQAIMGAAVIPNPAQQSDRENEEHVYDDLLAVCSTNEQISGNSVEMKEMKQSEEKPILLVANPYVTDSSLSSPRPLPFQPNQNNGHNVVGQGDVSMVVENPSFQGSQSEELLRAGEDFVHQQEGSEEKEEETHDHHQHQHRREDAVDGTEEENPDYQGLEKGKRARSMFICPSCNANSYYQRLSRPGHCPHEGNQERQEKSRSLYESLTTDRGTQESFYTNPSRTDEEEQDNAIRMPNYQTLEPEETESNEAQDKPTTHDYSVLEEPEQASIEPLDEDKKHEPPVSPKAEKSLVYAVPCKKKTAKKSESGSSKLDRENKKIEDVCLKDEDSNEMLDPSAFVKVGEGDR